MNGKNNINSISYTDAANFLKNNDNFYILTHLNPDGDAMGSGFALCNVLRSMGKMANVLCSDPLPKRYEYLYEGYEPMKFTPKTIVSVDLADTKLFGKELAANRTEAKPEVEQQPEHEPGEFEDLCAEDEDCGSECECCSDSI